MAPDTREGVDRASVKKSPAITRGADPVTSSQPSGGWSYVEVGEASFCLGMRVRAAPRWWRFAKTLVARAPAQARLPRYHLRMDFEERGAYRAFDQRHPDIHLH